MLDLSKEAIVLKVGHKYYSDNKKNIIFSWSLSGAKMFVESQNSAYIEIKSLKLFNDLYKKHISNLLLNKQQ
jgi:hypothetical protein